MLLDTILRSANRLHEQIFWTTLLEEMQQVQLAEMWLKFSEMKTNLFARFGTFNPSSFQWKKVNKNFEFLFTFYSEEIVQWHFDRRKTAGIFKK